MNFDKLFFRLLIIKTLYQYGLGVDEFHDIASLSEITVVSDKRITYTSPVIYQYENTDQFRILDWLDSTLYFHYFKDDFSSKSIEFTSLYDLEMEFSYRQSDNVVLHFKCIFSEKKFIQAFFRKVFSFQQKGDSVSIFKIARYFDTTRQIEPYVTNAATIYSKDITEFVNRQVLVQKTFFITHFDDTNSTMEMEADLIFSTKNFAISDIYENNKIALCIRSIADERFLIRFSDQTAGQQFLTAHMPKTVQRDNLHCEFPEDVTPEQVFENLEFF